MFALSVAFRMNTMRVVCFRSCINLRHNIFPSSIMNIMNSMNSMIKIDNKEENKIML